jgi:hypothetical protein
MNVDQRGTAQHRSAQKPSSGLNIKKKKQEKREKATPLFVVKKSKLGKRGGSRWERRVWSVGRINKCAKRRCLH